MSNGAGPLETFRQQVLAQYNSGQRTITLGSNIDQQVATLLGFAQTASVALSEATVTSTPTQVMVRGNGVMEKLGGGQVIELVGTEAAGKLGLTLTAVPRSAIDLSRLFPGLPGTTQNVAGVMVERPSLFYQVSIRNPAWLITDIAPPSGAIYPAVGLNLRADIPLSPDFAHLTALTGFSTVTLKGPIAFPPDDVTELYLTADFPGFTMGIGTLRMHDFQLLLRTVYYSDEPEFSFSGNQFNGVLDISPGVVARIGVDTQSVPREGTASTVWAFYSDFGKDGLSLSAGLNALAVFIGGDAAKFDLPTGVRELGSFALTRLVVGVDPYHPTIIDFVFIEVGTPKRWEPPIPYIAIEDLRLQWQILQPFAADRSQSGGVGGTLVLGKDKPVHLDVSATIPEFIINANLRYGDRISIVDVLSTFFPDAGGLSQDLVIDDLNIVANFDSKVYELAGSLKPIPPLSLDLIITTLTLEGVSASVNYSQDALYATILADLILFSKGWTVSAEYLRPGEDADHPEASEGNWIFALRLRPGDSIDLSALVAKFLNFDPALIPTVSLEGLYCRYNLGDKTYVFRGTVKGYWLLNIIPGQPALQASAEVDVASLLQNRATVYAGSVIGRLSIGALNVTVGYAFSPSNTNYTFSIVYKRFALYATLMRTTKKKDGEDVPVSVLRISLGDISVGEIIEYLVGLANPYVEFRLDAPWDILNSLNLKNLALVVDLVDNTVGIEYRLDLELVFIYIESIGLTYAKRADGRGTVRIALKGRFLEQSFGDGDALSWDLLDDPAPAVPGRGNSLFDLKFVGLGQHVALAQHTSFESVSEVIDALRAEMKPVENPNANPLSQAGANGLQFDKDSNLLFGSQFVVLDGISLSVVFNDPYLYGLLIELSGDVAGSLGGLKFELLYNRITDSLGVFKVVLRVPDAFRQLEFGQVSVTLPIIKVDIYTNGNFKVDLGFPTAGDFTESFAVQVFPFIGKGGFYFGYLVGAASKTVPRITNGAFAPVIELGLALAVGVGKEIARGPLSAGLSLTVQAILEGTIAWFQPQDQSQPEATYYRVIGTAAIVGKLYGAVDFKVIKVSVAVTARASVTLVVECYRPIAVSLSVEVSVEASVDILFITIHFSFDISLDLSFEIGSASPTPWVVDPAATQPALPRHLRANRALPGGRRQGVNARGRRVPHRLRLRIPPHRVPARLLGRRPRTAIAPRLRVDDPRLQGLAPAALQALAAMAPAEPAFNWTPVAVFSSVQSLPVLILPALTVAQNSYLLPADRSAGAVSNQLALTFVLENGIDPHARTLAELRTMSAAAAHATSDPAQLPFNLLARGMLAWSIASFVDGGGSDVLGGNIDRWELAALNKALDQAEQNGDAFSAATLKSFLDLNYLFRIGAYTGDPAAVNKSGASFMPILPPLTMTLPGRDPIDFTAFRLVGAIYEDTVARYFAETAVDFGVDTAGDPKELVALTPADPDAVSVAAMVQRDYFMLIARSAADTALGLMQALPRAVTASNTLAGIAADYPRVAVSHVVQAGETTAVLENTYFMTLAELQQLNPDVDFSLPLPAGLALEVLEGPTIESIVQANKDLSGLLADGATLPIEGANYQLRSGDTLAAVASRLGVALADLVSRNQESRELLAVGRAFQLPAFTYTSVAGDTLDFVAAWLIVRNGGDAAVPAQDWLGLPRFSWYEQAVAMLNYQGDFIDFARPIVPGTSIKVPPAFDQSSPEVALTYVSRAGDTLARIAGYFLLVQNPTAGYLAFRGSLQVAGNPAPTAPLPVGTSVGVPAWQHRIQAVDSLALFSDALGLGRATLLGSSSLQDPAILAPLAVLALPRLNYVLPDGTATFASLAQLFNMDLDALAQSLAATSGYFVPGTITIPDIASIAVDALLAATVAGANQIASTASRFMMHGLRLPAVPPSPNDPVDTSALYGLYEIVGQQIPVDQFNLPLSIGLSSNDIPDPPARPGGIRFYQTHLVVAGETWQSLLQEYPNLAEYNPGIVPTDVKPGLLLFVVQHDDLAIVVDQAFVNANKVSPALTLSWANPTKPIAPLSLVETSPLRTTLPGGVHWQAATPPAWAGKAQAPATGPGEPTLWPLTQGFIDRIRAGETGDHAYRLMQGTVDADGRMQLSALALYDWAALVELRLRRVPLAPPATELAIEEEPPPKAATGYMRTTYELLPSSEETQRVLLALWSWIKAHPDDANADIRVLYAPSSQSDNPDGWQSLDIDKSRTFVFRSNLSTLSASGHAQSAAMKALLATHSAEDVDQLVVAGIAQAADFLELVWDADVVGGAGYFFNYVADGQGLPETIFDQQDNASLRLLVILPSQSRAANPDRSFHTFNTCAVVGDNITLAGANVFLERTDGSEQVRAATVPPGVFAFAGTRNNPGSNPPLSGVDAWRTQVLYSLIGWRSVPSAGFKQSNSALPIGPAVPPGMQEQFRASRAGTDLPWYYQQNLQAYTLAIAAPVSASTHLPPPVQDPYAGIGADVEVSVGFTVHDIYGNRLDPTNPIPDIPLRVGYTDPLIPLPAWPGTTASYTFTGIENPNTHQYDNIGIRLALSFQTANYVAGAGTDPRRAQTNVSADALKYAQVYYQIEQPDLTLRLATTLMRNPDDPSGTYPVDLTGLRQYVQSVCIFLAAAPHLEQSHVTVALGTSVTLASIAQAWPVTVAALGQANATARLDLLLASVTIPNYAVFPQQGTLRAVASAAGLTAAALATQNADAPLGAGVTLLTPDRTFVTAAGTSLGETARANRTTVDNIATRNAAVGGLLVEGVAVTVDDVTLAVEDQDSFDDLVMRFAAVGIATSPRAIAAANADTFGLVVGNQTVTVSAYVAAEGQTFASLAALFVGWTVAAIATASQDVQNSVRPGTALYLAPGSSVTPAPGDTLAGYATIYGRTVAQLALANAAKPLIANAKVLLPGLAAIGGGPVFVPFAIPLDATWTTIVTALGQTSSDAQVALMTANERTPDLMLAGVTITIGGDHATTTDRSTFRSVLDALNQGGAHHTYGDLVAAISTTPKLMRRGGAVAAPPPAIPASTSLGDAAAALGLSAAALAVANAALSPLIAAGRPVTFDTPSGSKTVTTVTNDSFATIAARFAADEDLTVSVEQIADVVARDAGFLVGGTRVMLPPAGMDLDVKLYATPPTLPPYPGTVFELINTLTLKRPDDAIHPDFADMPAVKAFSVAIAPRLGLDRNGSYLLAPFAARAEAIFAGLKVAVGAQPSDAEAHRVPHLFAVNFTSTGLAKVDITAGNPVTLAIKPLSTSPLGARGLEVSALEGDGTLGPARPHDFDAVDLDTWANDLLAAIDLLLSPQFAVPAHSLDAASFGALTAHKASLASTVSNGLIPVLDGAVALDLAAARRRLQQALLASLGAGFSTAALLQYGATVTATGAGNARLSGRPSAVLTDRTRGVFTLTLTADTTFEAITSFFGITMFELMAQIANLTPLLRTGAVFAFPPQPPYTVPSATTTLQDVAAHFDLLEPTPLAEYNRTVAGLFVPGTVLSITMPIPDFDLSVGKLPLASGSGTIEFVLNVPKAREHKTLLANLDYQINELEYDIAPISGSGGFSSSRWLSFVVPITAASHPAAVARTLLGQADIPLVLRAYPELPVLRDQVGEAAVAVLPPDFPANLLAARKWKYRFDFEQIRAAQDATFLAANYNGMTAAAARTQDDPMRTLFAALAQFALVWPQLKKDLLGLLDPATVARDAQLLKNALATFRGMVANVSTAWAAFWPPAGLSAQATVPQPGRFAAEVVPLVDARTDTPMLRSLVLKAQNAAGYDFDQYPDIAYFDIRQDGFVPLLKSPTTDKHEVVYVLPAPILAYERLVWRYTFDQLDVIAQENAAAELVVKRNVELLPGTRTADDFVYQTPSITFPEPVYPALLREEFIDARTSASETLAQGVQAIFAALLGADPQDQTLKVIARYGYELATPLVAPASAGIVPGAIVSEIPVTFFPKFPYAASFQADLVAALDTWFQHHHPETRGGMYLFELTVYSTLMPDLIQPTLTLRRVAFPLAER